VAAIDVGRAEIEFDLAAFLTGDFAWRRADIRDGLVRVSEDARGRVNMEETFKSRAPSSPEAEETEEGGEMNMRTMVTSNMRLVIGGGSLPTLRLVDRWRPTARRRLASMSTAATSSRVCRTASSRFGT
jgi:hypothetical protein